LKFFDKYSLGIMKWYSIRITFKNNRVTGLQYTPSFLLLWHAKSLQNQNIIWKNNSEGKHIILKWQKGTFNILKSIEYIWECDGVYCNPVTLLFLNVILIEYHFMIPRL
jgi:hypothetical protein